MRNVVRLTTLFFLLIVLTGCDRSVSGISSEDFQVSLVEHDKLNFINFQCVASADTYDDILWEFPSGELVSGFKSITAHFPYKGEYVIKVKVTKGINSSEFKKTVFVRRDDPYVSKGEKLVWHEEFDDVTLNPELWNVRANHYENNHWRESDGSQNISVVDGALKIITHNDDEPQKVGNYSSIQINTQGNKEFAYGRIEFRAKLPANKNIRTTLSLFGNDIDEVGWPACGEMNITDRIVTEPRAIYSGVHTFSDYEYASNADSVSIDDFDTEFHTYGIHWTPDKIDFYVDAPEKVYYSYFPKERNSRTWPFSKPFFVALGLVMGGDRIGRQGVDNGPFSQVLYIDYIRVYQSM